MLLSLNSSQPPFVLQDPFAQFIASNAISIFLAFAGFILSIVFYFQSRRRKAITWEKISELTVDTRSSINRRSKPIRKATELVLRIWNSGNETIEESDYRSPIKFNFGKGAKVLHAEILETTKESLRSRANNAFKSSVNTVILEPVLLNSKDTIEFRVTLTGFTSANKITIENLGIVGVYEISEKRPLSEAHKGKLLLYTFLLLLISQVLGYGLQILLELILPPGIRFNLILGTLLFMIILFLKNIGTSVFLFYGLLLIYNGIVELTGRGHRLVVKSMRSVIIFCVGASILTTLPFIIVPISLLSR